MVPFVFDWEENKNTPPSLIKEFADNGILALSMGFTKWPEKFYPNKTICEVHIEKPDIFHEVILT